jgi:hypothetical protein
MSHRTRTAQFAHQAHKPPIAHTAQRTAPPSALSSQHPCMRTSCPTRAAAVAPGWHLHCHATSMLRHGLHTGTRPTDERTTARLAGVARRTRRAAHPSRTPTAASPGRSPRLLRLAAAPSPLPTALAAHCRQRLSRLRAQLLQRAKFSLPPLLCLQPGLHTAQPARGICRVRGIQGTRAGDRGCTADGRIGEPTRRPAAMLTESMSTPSISLVTSDRDSRLQDS